MVMQRKSIYCCWNLMSKSFSQHPIVNLFAFSFSMSIHLFFIYQTAKYIFGCLDGYLALGTRYWVLGKKELVNW